MYATMPRAQKDMPQYRHQPLLRAAQVQGLAGERALHVACGVWHTAAVAAQSLSVQSAQHSRSSSSGSGLDPAEWDAIQQKMADAYRMLDEVSCHGQQS